MAGHLRRWTRSSLPEFRYKKDVIGGGSRGMWPKKSMWLLLDLLGTWLGKPRLTWNQICWGIWRQKKKHTQRKNRKVKARENASPLLNKGKAKVLSASFALVFTGKTKAFKHPTCPKTKGKVWSNEDLSSLEENQVKQIGTKSNRTWQVVV